MRAQHVFSSSNGSVGASSTSVHSDSLACFEAGVVRQTARRSNNGSLNCRLFLHHTAPNSAILVPRLLIFGSSDGFTLDDPDFVLVSPGQVLWESLASEATHLVPGYLRAVWF